VTPLASVFSRRVENLELRGGDVLAIHGIAAQRAGTKHVKIRCPLHAPDTTPSCSVELTSGRTHCFGCDFKAGDVVALHRALGKFPAMGDALRDLERRAGRPVPKLEIRLASANRRGSGKRFSGERIVVKTWIYRTVNDAPAFEVRRVQFRLPDGLWLIDADKGKPKKIYLPYPPGGTASCMPAPYSDGTLRPLFNLPALLAAEADALVYVVEGEPCVDALTSVGLLATTSSGGASNPHRSDWTPLAGRRVVVWPDNDEPGVRYAQEVTTSLRALRPAPTVRWVEFEKVGLPPGGDAVDWLRTKSGGPHEF
jgi:CHC2 zinc finger